MKMHFTPESQMILRHSDDFVNSNVLFSGDIEDLLPCYFTANSVNVHITKYDRYQKMKDKINGKIEFCLFPHDVLYGIDTLVYFWPKSKQEAKFQLFSLLHHLTSSVRIFIVGENRTGVRSCEKWLLSFGHIKKIDSAKRCSFYYFKLEKPITFDISEWWQQYQLTEGSVIHTLPGVFSVDHIDQGSKLLLKALVKNSSLVKGDVLDVGCGAGVLSVALTKINPNIYLTLSDTNIAALTSCKATLAANNIEGNIIASDIFSNIKEKFDLIISNPPFHNGLTTDYVMIKQLISQAHNYLKSGGLLCIVANSFLPYKQWLDQSFNQCRILLQTNKFKVYLALSP